MSEAHELALALTSLADIAPQVKEPLRIEELRELAVGEEFREIRAPAPTLRELKASHHKLASLLAKGTSVFDAALITGYAPGYCSGIQNDPSFQELMEHYRTVNDLAVMDIEGQLQALGAEALAEIRDRMQNDPKSFSVGQLMEQVRLGLVETRKVAQALTNPGVGGVVISFHNSDSSSRSPTVIEHRNTEQQ